MRNVLLSMGALMLLLLACGGNGGSGKMAYPTGTEEGPTGAKLFRTHCTLCHGNDGRLGINGAKDLTVSALTREEMIALVSNGRGAMAAYKHVLSKAEIEAVVEHVRSLHLEE